MALPLLPAFILLPFTSFLGDGTCCYLIVTEVKPLVFSKGVDALEAGTALGLCNVPLLRLSRAV